jgi:hypothetical protein
MIECMHAFVFPSLFCMQRRFTVESRRQHNMKRSISDWLQFKGPALVRYFALASEGE